MYKNLQAEMVRYNVSRASIAAAIQRSEKSFGQKINGKFPFTIREAFAIKLWFFPELDLDYLFEEVSDEQHNHDRS